MRLLLHSIAHDACGGLTAANARADTPSFAADAILFKMRETALPAGSA
ncbi:hypothetical protein ACQZ50_14195 [Agrobacterium sp. 22-3674a1]